jgi:hypothetical protein
MREIARIPLVLALVVAYSRLACGSYDQYGEVPINDMVLVTFAFDFHRDGSVHNIRVWRCSNAKDLGLADDALTAEEKAAGIRIVASSHMQVAPDDLGKTRYTYLIFDKRHRTYMKT